MLCGHAEHTKLRIKIIREILVCNNELATIGDPDDASTIRKRMHYKVTDIILIQLYFKELLRLLISKDDIVLPKFLLCGIHLWTAEAASTLSNHNIRNGRIRCLNPLTAKFFFCFNLLYFDRFTSHHNKNHAYFQTAPSHCSKS